MENQVMEVRAGNGAEINWDWSNVLESTTHQRSGGGRVSKTEALGQYAYEVIGYAADVMVANLSEAETDRDELVSLVCSDFRNVLSVIENNPYVITKLCEVLGIESNIGQVDF